jgi:hypothetical protein
VVAQHFSVQENESILRTLRCGAVRLYLHEKPRKILEAFQSECLRGGGIGIALEVETESSLHENVNSKIYVKEKILWQKAFSYGFSEFRSA